MTNEDFYSFVAASVAARAGSPHDLGSEKTQENDTAAIIDEENRKSQRASGEGKNNSDLTLSELNEALMAGGNNRKEMSEGAASRGPIVFQYTSGLADMDIASPHSPKTTTPASAAAASVAAGNVGNMATPASFVTTAVSATSPATATTTAAAAPTAVAAAEPPSKLKKVKTVASK